MTKGEKFDDQINKQDTRHLGMPRLIKGGGGRKRYKKQHEAPRLTNRDKLFTINIIYYLPLVLVVLSLITKNGEIVAKMTLLGHDYDFGD